MLVWLSHCPAQLVAPKYCSRPIIALALDAASHVNATACAMGWVCRCLSAIASANPANPANAAQNHENKKGPTAGVGPGEKGFSQGRDIKTKADSAGMG